MRNILEFVDTPLQRNSGQYRTACPWCGEGENRLVIWPNAEKKYGKGTYWCRRCDEKGDAIGWVRKKYGLTFSEALRLLEMTPTTSPLRRFDTFDFDTERPKFKSDSVDYNVWSSSMTELVTAKLSQSPPSGPHIDFLRNRGITEETWSVFGISWNPEDEFLKCEAYGMSHAKTFVLRKGLIIPTWHKGSVVAVNVRCEDHGKEYKSNDSVCLIPKYAKVKGSKTGSMVLGAPGRPVVIVESELDGYLVNQEAGHIVTTIVLGGTHGELSNEAQECIEVAPVVFLAFDFDATGENKSTGPGQVAALKWKNKVPSAKFLPPVTGKDPSEMHMLGVSIKSWLDLGFKRYLT